MEIAERLRLIPAGFQVAVAAVKATAAGEERIGSVRDEGGKQKFEEYVLPFFLGLLGL